ncbi:MAG: hypothetical protein LUG88_06715 [Clostridia bacterium]|nr:hypothetical protein [Clostridia bacterium]
MTKDMTGIAIYELFHLKMKRMKRPAAVIFSLAAAGAGLLSGLLYGGIWGFFFIPVSSAVLASLIYMYRSPFVYAAPVISAILTLAIKHGGGAAVFAALYAVPATVLAVSIYREKPKVHAVVSASVSIFAAAALFALGVYVISPDSLLTYDGIIKSVENALSSVTVNSGSGQVRFFTDEGISAVTEYLSISLPAVLVLIAYAVSYASASLLSAMMKLFSFADKIPGGVGKWIYESSPVSALMFIISYFVSVLLIPYTNADAVGVAAENLLLILTPPMMIAGERIFFGFASAHYKMTIAVVVTVIAVLVTPSMYLMIISFLGAGYILYKASSPYISKLIGKFGGDDDDDDDDDDFYE